MEPNFETSMDIPKSLQSITQAKPICAPYDREHEQNETNMNGLGTFSRFSAHKSRERAEQNEDEDDAHHNNKKTKYSAPPQPTICTSLKDNGPDMRHPSTAKFSTLPGLLPSSQASVAQQHYMQQERERLNQALLLQRQRSHLQLVSSLPAVAAAPLGHFEVPSHAHLWSSLILQRQNQTATSIPQVQGIGSESAHFREHSLALNLHADNSLAKALQEQRLALEESRRVEIQALLLQSALSDVHSEANHFSGLNSFSHLDRQHQLLQRKQQLQIQLERSILRNGENPIGTPPLLNAPAPSSLTNKDSLAEEPVPEPKNGSSEKLSSLTVGIIPTRGSRCLDGGCLMLGIDEDHNWLSRYHCYVRTNISEVFEASIEDCRGRSHNVRVGQVGIRCRFCSKVDQTYRGGRAAAFPSSLQQVYQSFNMMLRDHFQSCKHISPEVAERLIAVRDKASHGAPETRNYWVYAARKLGLTDCETGKGIVCSGGSVEAGKQLAPFGSDILEKRNGRHDGTEVNVMDRPEPTQIIPRPPLLLPAPKSAATGLLSTLLNHSEQVTISKVECMANRRHMPVGMVGLGCRYCCSRGWRGMARVFPGRRRVFLPRLEELEDHFLRCPLCPVSVKEQLVNARPLMSTEGTTADTEAVKAILDTAWLWMGREQIETPTFQIGKSVQN
jgi:hypothetical protein